jgi:hypothetical protein
MSFLCKLGFHKFAKPLYISSYVEVLDGFPYVIGVYNINCKRCNKSYKIERAFWFDSYSTIQRRKAFEEKYNEPHPCKSITRADAIIKAQEYKGD